MLMGLQKGCPVILGSCLSHSSRTSRLRQLLQRLRPLLARRKPIQDWDRHLRRLYHPCLLARCLR